MYNYLFVITMLWCCLHDINASDVHYYQQVIYVHNQSSVPLKVQCERKMMYETQKGEKFCTKAQSTSTFIKPGVRKELRIYSPFCLIPLSMINACHCTENGTSIKWVDLFPYITLRMKMCGVRNAQVFEKCVATDTQKKTLIVRYPSVDSSSS